MQASLVDSVLIPSPFYPGFLSDMSVIPRVNAYPVYLRSQPGPSGIPWELTVHVLEETLIKAKSEVWNERGCQQTISCLIFSCFRVQTFVPCCLLPLITLWVVSTVKSSFWLTWTSQRGGACTHHRILARRLDSAVWAWPLPD